MKIQVLSPEIGKPNEKLNHDYWVRKNVNEAIVALGHEALPPHSTEVPDIQIVFAGMDFDKTRYNPIAKFRAVWIYSRPDEVAKCKARLKQFHQIYSLTAQHSSIFKKQTGLTAKPLRIATDKIYNPATKPYAFDIAYMGSKVDYRLKTLIKLADCGYKIVVVGYGWPRVKYKNIHVTGRFWPNEDFSAFYNYAPLSVYPTRGDFIEAGIVPIRVMDIYASSDCMCLCASNSGLFETFATSPPQYENTAQLIQVVDFFLKNPEERKHRQAMIREGIQRRYTDLVLDVVVDAMNFWSKK